MKTGQNRASFVSLSYAMTQTIRQFILVIAVAAALCALAAWLIPPSKEPDVWWFRVGSLLVFCLAIWYYRWSSHRANLAPDFFADRPRFFEKDGFCFHLATEVQANVGCFSVYYQNRYERPCEATVMVRTAERFLGPQRHLPDATVSFICEPGGYGKATTTWPIPTELQGKQDFVDVMASRKYPQRRGKLLRFKAGLPVGSVPRTAGSDALRVLAIFGGINTGGPARAQLTLPRNVASTVLEPKQQTQTLWKLGDPTPQKTVVT
jgi:hypothetical protein